MNEQGKALLEKISEVHNQIEQAILEQQSSRAAFHKTMLNLRDFFFENLSPSTSNQSVNFYTLGDSDIEAFINNLDNDMIGIYIFLLRVHGGDEIENFKENWRHFYDGNKQSMKIPPLNSYEHRHFKVQGNDEYRHILYIGKSERLSKRLKDHVVSGSSSTYCLRLKEFLGNVDEDYKIELCWLYTGEHDVIPLLYPIEKFLREIFPPLVGSGR